jgi:hypothetical protein
MNSLAIHQSISIDFPFKELETSITLNRNQSDLQIYRYIGTDISMEKYFAIDSLEKKYFLSSDTIKSFLLKNVELVSFLNRAYLELIKRFPESVYLIEVVDDFEIENWSTLYLKVSNNLEDNSFDEKLMSFISEHMLSEPIEVRKLVTIKELY